MKDLTRMFSPHSVAIIGASAREGSVGHDILKNLISKTYLGKVYPVNPKRESILGVKAYPSISAVPDTVDLVIIATPCSTVSSLVEECARAHVGGIVIITAGFKELGEKGMVQWNELTKTIEKHNIPVLGPNCLGFIKPGWGLNASFASKMPQKGKIAFVSQSGALCTAMLDWAITNNIGFSHFISIGSMADINFSDLIEHLGNDDDTSAILLYIESLADAQRFLRVAQKVSPRKPIIALKVGKTEQGAHAASSHTGSLAGNDLVYSTAFERAGVLRIETIAELFDYTEFLAKHDEHVGKNVAIITNAGGPGVIATDKLIELGGTLAKLSPETITSLNETLPEFWSHGNPIDILGDAEPERYAKTVEICANDPQIDVCLVILTPQAMTQPTKVADLLAHVDMKGKALAVAFIGGEDIADSAQRLQNIPYYTTPESALSCIVKLGNRKKQENHEEQTKYTVHHEHVQRVFNEAHGKCALTEDEAKQVLDCYGIHSGKRWVARNEEELQKACGEIGFPLVLKIHSRDILHKTEVKGVRANIKTYEEALVAFHQIIQSARTLRGDARLDGVLVEEQTSFDFELLLGAKKDPLFGHSIVFGMGGTAVELYKDTVLELAPISEKRAREMILSTKIGKLMNGYRGMKHVNIDMLAEILCRFSQLLSDFPQITELDINPLAVSMKGDETIVRVLDAKVVFE